MYAYTTYDVAKECKSRLNLSTFTVGVVWEYFTLEEKQEIAKACNCPIAVLALTPVAIAIVRSLISNNVSPETHRKFRNIATKYINQRDV